MIQYIIRRSLYAIPIVIGINLLVFFLFFFVNTPDKIAKRHLGQKAHSQEKIEDWKREHNYHLPLAWHDGYDALTYIENRIDSRNGVVISNDYITPGEYFIDIKILKGETSPCVLRLEKVLPSVVENKSSNPMYIDKLKELNKLKETPSTQLTKFDPALGLEFDKNYVIDISAIDNIKIKIEEIFDKGYGMIAYLSALKSSTDLGDAKVKLSLSKLQVDYIASSEKSNISMIGGQAGREGFIFVENADSLPHYLEIDAEENSPSDFYFYITNPEESAIESYINANEQISSNEWMAKYKLNESNAINFENIKNHKVEFGKLYHAKFDSTQQGIYSKVRLPEDMVDGKAVAINFHLSEKTTFEGKLNLTLTKGKGMEFVGHIQQTILFQKGLQLLWFKFGKSDTDKIPIGYQIRQRMWPSLSLTIPTFILSLFVGITLSMIVAFYRGSYIDVSATILCVLGMSISSLFYIILGQIFFSEWLKIFPISGYDSSFWEIWRFVSMPVIIGIIMGLGGRVRFYRTLFLEEISRDYIRTARAKGLSETKVLFKHGLKNTMIPILTSVVMTIPFLFMGSFLFETFFSIPGLGSFAIEAILSSDFSVVRSMVYISSLLYIIGLILTDISYVMVDPRIKFS